MLGCIIVTFFWFPETKGRTPAELDEMFEARIPARQFKSKGLVSFGKCKKILLTES